MEQGTRPMMRREVPVRGVSQPLLSLRKDFPLSSASVSRVRSHSARTLFDLPPQEQLSILAHPTVSAVPVSGQCLMRDLDHLHRRRTVQALIPPFHYCPGNTGVPGGDQQSCISQRAASRRCSSVISFIGTRRLFASPPSSGDARCTRRVKMPRISPSFLCRSFINCFMTDSDCVAMAPAIPPISS
jgi:hypothetical protein